jgi:hypothetical protein
VRKDLKCTNCQANEATRLLYFRKYYQDTAKFAFFHPQLLCKPCADSVLKSDRLFQRQPVFVTFLQMAKKPMQHVMALCSPKGKEHNDMAYPIWRKKLLRIRKIYEGRLNSYTNKILMPL